MWTAPTRSWPELRLSLNHSRKKNQCIATATGQYRSTKMYICPIYRPADVSIDHYSRFQYSSYRSLINMLKLSIIYFYFVFINKKIICVSLTQSYFETPKKILSKYFTIVLENVKFLHCIYFSPSASRGFARVMVFGLVKVLEILEKCLNFSSSP